jgi:hypothetical protein
MDTLTPVPAHSRPPQLDRQRQGCRGVQVGRDALRDRQAQEEEEEGWYCFCRRSPPAQAARNLISSANSNQGTSRSSCAPSCSAEAREGAQPVRRARRAPARHARDSRRRARRAAAEGGDGKENAEERKKLPAGWRSSAHCCASRVVAERPPARPSFARAAQAQVVLADWQLMRADVKDTATDWMKRVEVRGGQHAVEASACSERCACVHMCPRAGVPRAWSHAPKGGYSPDWQGDAIRHTAERRTGTHGARVCLVAQSAWTRELKILTVCLTSQLQDLRSTSFSEACDLLVRHLPRMPTVALPLTAPHATPPHRSYWPKWPASRRSSWRR